MVDLATVRFTGDTEDGRGSRTWHRLTGMLGDEGDLEDTSVL